MEFFEEIQDVIKMMSKRKSKVALAATLALLASAAPSVAGQPARAPAPTAAKPAPTKPAPTRNSAAALRLPEAPTLFRTRLPSVVKASAIVNGSVITQTDINQRMALMTIVSGEPLPADQIAPLRQQILANLIDEKLQIQAAAREEIKIDKTEIDRATKRLSDQLKQTPTQFAAYLKSNGSSVDTVRQQIEGELAWSRLQQARMEDNVAVGDDEVQSVIDKLKAAKGQREYRVSEIFLSANAANHDSVMQRAEQILDALRKGQNFAAYARQFSEASTAGVGGDLGWVKPVMLASPLDQMVGSMEPNTISRPVDVVGGISILAVRDVRQILTADPRNAVLSLKQVTIPIQKGAPAADINALIQRFGEASQKARGCGGADKLAAQFGGDVVSSDRTAMADLPPALQQLLAPLQVGQATAPFGSVEEGARVLIICGRDQQEARLPTFDEVYQQLNQERINLKAQRYLRDLRRDAIIEYR